MTVTNKAYKVYLAIKQGKQILGNYAHRSIPALVDAGLVTPVTCGNCTGCQSSQRRGVQHEYWHCDKLIFKAS